VTAIMLSSIAFDQNRHKKGFILQRFAIVAGHDSRLQLLHNIGSHSKGFWVNLTHCNSSCLDELPQRLR
jgi:hypothetical protein